MLAIMAALGMNPIFTEGLLDALPVSGHWANIALLLAAIAGVLVGGVLWHPIVAAHRGDTLSQSMERVVGRWAARLVAWTLIPAVFFVLFHLHFQTLHWILMEALNSGGLAPRGSPAWSLAGLGVTVLLALLTWLGCWDSWHGYGRSATFLVKVSFVGWLGLILSLLPGIPEGALRARSGLAIDYSFVVGVFLLWFGAPLWMMGHRLSMTLPSSFVRRPGLSLWMCLCAVLAVVYLLVRYLYLGMLGTYPKVLNLLGSGATDTRLGVAKVMVLCLCMLVVLRLGPRLLADLWGIPEHSVWRAFLVASMAILSAKAPNNWMTTDLMAAMAVPILALAGTLSGAEWGDFLRRRRSGAKRGMEVSGLMAPKGNHWYLWIWVGGLLLPSLIPWHRYGLPYALWELCRLPNSELPLDVGVMFLGLLDLRRLMWLAGYYWVASSVIVPWLLCFGGAFALGLRRGVPEVVDRQYDKSA